jgi:serine/threonine protein kinase
VKIADFGISKRIEDGLGMPSTIKGTIGFMAPEICGLIENLSIESLTDKDQFAVDIWALGEITYRMLTGRPAFSSMAALVSYSRQPDYLPSGAELDTYVSPVGCDFVRGLLRAHPLTRPGLAAAISHDWIQNRVQPNPLECNPVREVSGHEPAMSGGDVFGGWTTVMSYEPTGSNTTAQPDRRSSPYNFQSPGGESSVGNGFQLPTFQPFVPDMLDTTPGIPLNVKPSLEVPQNTPLQRDSPRQGFRPEGAKNGLTAEELFAQFFGPSGATFPSSQQPSTTPVVERQPYVKPSPKEPQSTPLQRDSPRQGFRPEGTKNGLAAEELFAQFFGPSGATFPSSQQPSTAPIVERQLALTLEELFSGTDKKLKVNRRVKDKEGNWTTVDIILTVSIKPGLKKGSKFKFKGQGNQVGDFVEDLHFIVDYVRDLASSSLALAVSLISLPTSHG